MIYRKQGKLSPSSFGNRRIVTTCQGGEIAIDTVLLTLWENAEGRNLNQLIGTFQAAGVSYEATRAALACLVEAGLLTRQGETASSSLSHSLFSLPFPQNPVVSIVIVNYNSLEWLKECLPSLAAQTYSFLEIVVVDNGSTENIIPWLLENYPAVKTLQLERTLTLAYALNRGVELAEGRYFLLLNPDVRLEPEAVAYMVAAAQKEPACAAVAAKLKFWWAPAFINGLGNQVGAFSWGRDNGLGHLDLGQFDNWKEVPSACFAAALISRVAWEVVGPLDEQFPMYYEDSEWSYRARLLGYKIIAAPKAVVYHAFGGLVHTVKDVDLSPGKLRRVVYGRLRFATKVTAPFTLLRFLIGYSFEDVANILVALFQLNGAKVRSVLTGWIDFLRCFPELLLVRRALQARRVHSDRELFALQWEVPPPFIWRGLPELTWDLVLHHYLPLFRSGKTRPMPEFNEPARPRLLIISHDIVDVKMAGPGMRYLEMARALTPDLDVTLAVPLRTSLEIPGIRLIPYQLEHPNSLRTLVDSSDIVLISGFILSKFPFLQGVSKKLVIDLYDPLVLENLHYYQNEPLTQQESLNTQAIDMMNRLLRLGDFFICGNERQRDFWIGALTANGSVNPRVFDQDPSLRSLIDVVGVGFPDRKPESHPMLRGIHPAFPEDCRIILWGGGIWDWLDPLTLVRAWPQVLARHPESRLVFLGTRHPNPLVPPHQAARQTQALASEISEKDRTIFFIEWLPYEEREGLLCEADIGVALHPLHVETRYSIRTRVVDYLWADLPVLVSDGDVTSEWVRQYDLGRVVPPLDPEAVAGALVDMLDKPKSAWKPAFTPLYQLFCWPNVVEPLHKYCLRGERAPDRKMGVKVSWISYPLAVWRARLARARFIIRSEGWSVLVHRTWKYIQWRLSQIY